MLAALYDWLMFLHIVAAMVWVGSITLLSIEASGVVARREPSEIARFTGTLRRIGPMVMAPAMIAVIVLGIWMVVDAAAWDFEQTWVWLAIALFVLAVAVGAIFQSRSVLAAERAGAGGDLETATSQLRRWVWGMRTILVILLVVTWDMVFKPGA